MITGLMTVKEFVETRHELPDGGRWHELHSGRPQLLDAPDDEHGTVVLNLSKVEFVYVVFDSASESEVKTKSNSLISHYGTLKNKEIDSTGSCAVFRSLRNICAHESVLVFFR